MLPIIDTHVHVWDLARVNYPWLKNDTSILNRSYDLSALEKDRLNTNVKAGVLVQAAEDTDLLLETAAANDWIKGIVGWLPLTNPSATQELLEKKYLKEKYFKGVRHQIHDEKDPQWLLQPAVIESLQILEQYDLPYELVGILPVHIETAIEVAEKVPGLRMVFDHLNQPPVARKEKFGQWGELMKKTSLYPNFYAKISGLGTASGNFTGWTKNDLQPYIEFVITQFGTSRCFCGGDWPVSLLAGSYSETWNAYEDILKSMLNEEQQKDVLYNNAVGFYKLDVELNG